VKKSVQRKRRNRKLLTYFFLFSAFLLFSYSAFFILYPLSKISVCANSISCVKNLSGKPEKDTIGIFRNEVVSVPEIKDIPQKTRVLGESTSTDKHIYVDLTNQRLMAYEGSKLIYTFIVSSGKYGKTPTGDFQIWIKLRATRMSGGSKELGTYYDLPNVPYTMFFYNNEVAKSAGYAIHGAYWHPPFGRPSSHGCVNLTPEDAKTIYDWASPSTNGWRTFPTEEDPGTMITIYGEAPLE
jgi:hypothetical protein